MPNTAEDLKKLKLVDLKSLAKGLGINEIYKYKKDDLISEILKVKSFAGGDSEKDHLEDESLLDEEKNTSSKKEKKGENTSEVSGILEILPDGFGFLRSNLFESGDDDIYVSPTQIKRFRLKNGDFITGLTRTKKDSEKFSPLIFVSTVNDDSPGFAINRKEFENLTPIYPNERILLENGSKNLTCRIVDLISPIGKGQRGLIVSKPKVGKTTLIKNIANAVCKVYKDIQIFILLIDERPEEVTDMEREVVGDNVEVIASTFDQLPSNHTKVSEMVLDRAKRLVEHGKDVMILLDSITRLTRAYNLTTTPSGRTLSGGLDPAAFYKPKRFFGAARKIENLGSLTILATALVDTGSRMDDVIFEEFKGTGNMEVHLDSELSNIRIFPAIDIFKSGTRREELLLSKDELEIMRKLRRKFSKNTNIEIQESFFETLEKTSSNKQFIEILKTTIEY